MAAGAIKAGSAFVELLAVDKGLQAGLAAAQKQMQQWGADMQAVGAALAGVGAAGVAALAASAVQFSVVGDALQKMALRTGFSVEALSRLSHAAGASGTSIAALENGVAKYTKTIAAAKSGNASAVKALAALGLHAEELSSLSREDQLGKIADAVAAIADPAERSARAMALFGDSGSALLPFLMEGSQGLKALADEADSLGIVLTDDDANSAAALNDALGRLASQFEAVTNQLGAALAPVLTDLSKLITPIIADSIAWIKANRHLVQAAAALSAAALVAGVAIAGVGTALATAATIGPILAPILATVAGAVAGLAAVAGVVAGAFFAFGGTIEDAVKIGGEALAWFGDKWQQLSSFVSASMGGITAAIAKGDIAGAFKVLWASINLAWQTGINGLTHAWIAFQERFLGYMPELTQGWEATIGFLSAAWAGFVDMLSAAWRGVTAWFGEVSGSMASMFAEDNKTLADYAYDGVIGVINAWSNLKSFWETLAKGIEDRWRATQRWLSDRTIEALGAVGAIDDVEGTKAQNAQQWDFFQKQSDDVFRGNMDAIEKQRKADVSAWEDRKKAARIAAAEMFTAQRESADEALRKAREEWQRAVEKAQEAPTMSAALVRAGNFTKGAEEQQLAGGPAEGFGANLLRQIEQGRIAAASEVKGGFGAASLRGLGADQLSDVPNEQLKEAKKGNEHLAAIREELENAEGLTFE